MKKLFLFFIAADLYAADCGYYGNGWTASNDLSFQTPECPSGYVEVPSHIREVDNTASCPYGYVDVSARYKEIMCDTARGTCSTSAYVCPAP